MLSEQEVLENFTYFNRCLMICELHNNGRNLTKNSICQKTSDSITATNINNLLKFLESNHFLKIDRERIPYVYKIDFQKLASFLRNSIYFERLGIIIFLTKDIYRY